MITSQSDIVIVGAGISGLTAAIDLAEQSQKRILVLEADAVAGGRVKSVALENGTVLNAGAHWFHGGDENAFYQWAQQRYDLGDAVMDDVAGRIALWGGKSDAQIAEAFTTLEDAYAHFHKMQPWNDISLHDLAVSTGSQDAIDVVKFMAGEWMAVSSGTEISCNEYFNDPLGPGGWQLKDGNDRLIREMVADAQSKGVEFRYNAPVTSIEESQIVLANGERIAAANVLVTVSAGVLKNKVIRFDAPVQAEVVRRTEGLIMGNLVKTIVPVREHFFAEAKMPRDLPVYMIDQPCFVHAQTAGKPTITLFRGGDASHGIETWSDEQKEQYVRATLSKIPGFKDVGDYRDGKILTTAWHSNPFTLGSYSVCKPHYKRSDPFHVGNVHFAGDAFLADPANSPGQMKGAWQSGGIAARNILKLI